MKNINIRHFSRPRRRESEPVVQNDLSYTPSQMMEMAEKGIAVSNQSIAAENFFDGVPVSQSTFELPLEQRRGVDVADCWQAETSIKKKAKNGLKNDKLRYGSNFEMKGGE